MSINTHLRFRSPSTITIFFYQEVPPILLRTNLKIFPSRKTFLEEYLVWRFWNYLFQNKGDSKLFSSGGFWPFDCKKVDLEFWLFFYTIGFFFRILCKKLKYLSLLTQKCSHVKQYIFFCRNLSLRFFFWLRASRLKITKNYQNDW